MREKADLLDLLDKLRKSEDRYRQLIEQASDAIYVLDHEGRFTEVNQSMCAMTGYNREELLQLNVADIVDPEQLKVDPLKYVPASAPVTSMVRERRFVHKSGEIFDVEINVKTFPNDRVMVIARDVTLRKRLQIELETAEVKFRTIADRSMVGIYIVQADQFVYVNPRFAEVFGYLPDEMLNVKAIPLIIHPDHIQTVTERVRARLSGELASVHYETPAICKDGTVKWVEFYGSRAVMDDTPCIIGTMLDITERKRAEDQILKEKESLFRSEANLQTILNNTDTAYLLLSNKLKIIEYNNIALQYAKLEFNYEPVEGRNLIAQMSAERRDKFVARITTVLAGNPISYESCYPEGQEDCNWYHVRIVPIADKEGRIHGAVFAATDITDRKRSEKHLQDAYDHITRHVASIKDMAWKQSHLIRSPLANLKALVNILKDDPADTAALSYIASELDRLDKVIIDMSDEASAQTIR